MQLLLRRSHGNEEGSKENRQEGRQEGRGEEDRKEGRQEGGSQEDREEGRQGQGQAQAERCVHAAADAEWPAGRDRRFVPMPRTEVTSKIWAYIKKNKLQDSVNRRMINADDKLKALFGKAQASMFELTKYVSKHLK